MRISFKYFLLSFLLSVMITACGPSDSEAQKLGFSSASEMKEIQSKGFKSKDEYAKSLGFDSAVEMDNANKQGYKTGQEYARSLGFATPEEMKSLQAKGFSTKKDFDNLVSSEAADPLKTCSRKLDPDYNYPISDKWTLVRCYDHGRVFVTEVTRSGANNVFVKTLFDVKEPLNYFVESGKDLISNSAYSMEDSLEVSCKDMRFRSVSGLTYYAGRMGTGQSHTNPPTTNNWMGFNNPIAIPELLKLACSEK